MVSWIKGNWASIYAYNLNIARFLFKNEELKEKGGRREKYKKKCKELYCSHQWEPSLQL
jgi:hypothetical protein